MEVFDFENNGTVADVTSVPEKYRSLYTEGTNDAGETVHVLADNVKGLVGDFVGVHKTLAGVRVDKKKVTDENAERRLATKAVEDLAQSLGLEAGDDGVATTLKAFVDDLQGQVKGGKELKINLDKIKEENDRRLAEVVAAKDADIAERDGVISQTLISDKATAALAAHKGSVELLLPHVKNQCRVVRLDTGNYAVQVLDAQGDARFGADGTLMGVEALVEEMKTQEAFGRAFESDVKGGSDTKPGSLNRNRQQQPDGEKSAVSKISDGLAARQRQAARA
jgi:hypothetical protein